LSHETVFRPERINPNGDFSIKFWKRLINNTDNNFMRYIRPAILLTAALFLSSFAVSAQENETKVVDEVIAVVNDGVITLSGVKREMKGAVDSKVQEGMKREDAQKQVNEKQGELIANLINEELLLQKAKELGIEKDVEADLNARFVQIMKQQNMKTLDQLYEAMRKEGIDPDDIREIWRRQATKDEVIRRDVQARTYWEPTGSDLKVYYEKNKAKFIKPETVTLSEIFLNFAGQTQESVRTRANDLVKRLRSGDDFAKLALANSESQDVQQTKGALGTVPIADLEKQFPQYAKAIKGLKTGGVADPVEDEVGVHILHVDERTAQASDATFDEDAVRRSMLEVNYPDAIKKYMTKLRQNAYIKISEAYRPVVSPLLFADDRKDGVDKAASQEQSSTENAANKNPKKPKNQKQK
jgi:peptidyl-prolyl cis-trans isomerase SurA